MSFIFFTVYLVLVSTFLNILQMHLMKLFCVWPFFPKNLSERRILLNILIVIICSVGPLQPQMNNPWIQVTGYNVLEYIHRGPGTNPSTLDTKGKLFTYEKGEKCVILTMSLNEFSQLRLTQFYSCSSLL